MASTLQLEFSQAMSDFKIMFPEMETDVIEAVLRANSGAVDATIDTLLQMSNDNHIEKWRHELVGSPDVPCTKKNQPCKPNLSSHENQLSNVSKAYNMDRSSTRVRLTVDKKKWNPPLLGPLPATFLRISPYSDLNLDDEQFASMLQNEEFMNELRWNQVCNILRIFK